MGDALEKTLQKLVLGDEQIARLRSEGVNDAQVRRLQNHLPLCWAALQKAPAKTDVLDVVRGVRRASDDLAKNLLTLVHRHGSLATIEAYARLEDLRIEQAHDTIPALSQLAQTVELLSKLSETVEGQLIKMPERRLRTASPAPLRMIENALLEGWEETYGPAHGGDWDDPRAGRAPPYPFAPSVNVDSPFGRVATICYEAIGVQTEPIRALRELAGYKRQRGRPTAPS